MSIWNKIKDLLCIYKKDDLITENATVIYSAHSGERIDVENYTTTFQTTMGIVIISEQPNHYYSMPKDTKVELSYWTMIDSKGNVMDYELEEVKKI